MYLQQSDLEDIINVMHPVINGIQKIDRVKITNYLEIVSKYSDKDFHVHFRFDRDAANKLINLFKMSNFYTCLKGPADRIPLSPEKHMLSFLWFVGHQSSSYRDVADRFGITLSAFIASNKMEFVKIMLLLLAVVMPFISTQTTISELQGGENNTKPFHLEIELDRWMEQEDMENKKYDMDLMTFFKNTFALKKKAIFEKLKNRSPLKKLHEFLLNIDNIRQKRYIQNEGNHVDSNIKQRQKRTFRSSAKTTTTTERFGDWRNPPKDVDTLTMYE
ncbi:hypothetical protein AGLY_018246 [Aphis glycines]|uniref:Transposase Helix-turn-helix domain-containing protein n=1 Tax=Aphis glycines TaxID=307491 RepID=A0A6G0STQ9_APHGL|nr:hypothetical protein AGLY_018246 [Aphis glycines]